MSETSENPPESPGSPIDDHRRPVIKNEPSENPYQPPDAPLGGPGGRLRRGCLRVAGWLALGAATCVAFFTSCAVVFFNLPHKPGDFAPREEYRILPFFAGAVAAGLVLFVSVRLMRRKGWPHAGWQALGGVTCIAFFTWLVFVNFGYILGRFGGNGVIGFLFGVFAVTFASLVLFVGVRWMIKLSRRGNR